MVFLRVNNEEAIKQTWSVVLTANQMTLFLPVLGLWLGGQKAQLRRGTETLAMVLGEGGCEAWWTPSPVSGLPGSELLQCVI